jgi:hypothetical protein
VTFEWINKQGVRSDEGYSVAFTGRYTLKYGEGQREMILEGESMYSMLEGREFGFSFYKGWREAKWDPPHEQEPISSADRLRIISNITNAFSFVNGRAVFE